MSYPYARIQVESPGNILTASNYNAEHDNHITNNIPASVDDYSANASQSNAQSDPGPIGTEVLAAALSVEIEQIRFVLDRIIGLVGWRSIPTHNLTTLASSLITSGTVMLFYQAAAPTGWTRVVTQDNKFIRVVSAGTPGSSGGTHAADIDVGSHVHAGPSHTHTIAHTHNHEHTHSNGTLHARISINKDGFDGIQADNTTSGVTSWTSDSADDAGGSVSGQSGNNNATVVAGDTGNTDDPTSGGSSNANSGSSGTADTAITSLGAGSYAYIDVLIASKD